MSRTRQILPLFALVFICINAFATASTLLHKGPRSGQNTKTIRGHTLTDPVDGFGDRYVVDFQAQIVTDVLIWKEIVDAGIKMDSCSKQNRRLFFNFNLSGDGIDKDDFKKHVVISISKEDYERVCDVPIPTGIDSIPDNDDTLFFKIMKSKDESGLLKLKVKMVSRLYAVPSVRATVHNYLVPPSFTGRQVIADDTDAKGYENSVQKLNVMRFGSVQPASNSSVILPTPLSRFSLSKTVSKDMGGGNINVQLSAGGKFSSWDIDTKIKCNWKLKCKLKAEVSWEQKFDASAAASLTFNAGFSKDTSGKIAQWPVSGGFNVNVPFLGKVGIGLFVKLDWVADISVETYTKLTASVWYEKKEKVSLDIMSAKLSVQEKEKDGGGTTSFDLGAEAGAKVTGFVGVRPAFGAEAGFGKELNAEINVGAKIGVEASIASRYPAYSPYTGSSAKVGICNKCHWVQGKIGVKGKDLSVVAVVDKQDKEWTLVDNLFYFNVGQLCAVEADSC